MDAFPPKPTRFARICVGALLAVALPAVARADYVGPDSIPQPPPAVGSAEGTPIHSPADLVTNQYAGRGLLFPTVSLGGPLGMSAAVTNLSGVAVWAPASWSQGGSGTATIDYSDLTVHLVKPGTTLSMSVGSLTVEVLGNAAAVGLFALNAHGGEVGSALTPDGTGPHGGTLFTVDAPDISGFVLGGYGHIASVNHSAASFAVVGPNVWGLAGVEFRPVAAPEPGGLVLAGFAAFALFGAAWRRRPRSLAPPSGGSLR